MFNNLLLLTIIILVLFFIRLLWCGETFMSIPILKKSNPLGDLLNKNINITTSFNGKEYVLVSHKKSDCQNNYNPNDCVANVLLLVEMNEYLEKIHDQKEINNNNYKLCIMNHQMECQRIQNKINPKEETNFSEYLTKIIPHIKNVESGNINPSHSIKNNCLQVPITCIPPEDNSAIFNLTKLSKHHNPKAVHDLYKITGRVMLPNGNYSKHCLSVPIGESNLNFACLEGTLNSNNDPLSSVELLEVPSKNTTASSYIIRFQTPLILANKYIAHDKKGKPILKYRYIGICKDETCGINKEKYFRLCLYDNETNPFVLAFTPKPIQN